MGLPQLQVTRAGSEKVHNLYSEIIRDRIF